MATHYEFESSILLAFSSLVFAFIRSKYFPTRVYFDIVIQSWIQFCLLLFVKNKQ